jgi:2-haloacid dehalogenase
MPAVTVVFDLVGTLLDPGALGEPFGAGRDLGLAALDDAVAMAMADTLAGEHRPFPELVRGGLERHVALRDLPREPIDAALDLLRRLPPYPGARAALARLRDAGCELAVLTNSAADAAGQMLQEAGLRDLVARVDGADAVGAYKPDPRVYAAGPPTAGAWFVAGHWWDVTGAARAGFRTAWISRDDRVLPATAPAPDVSAADLTSAAEAILAGG